MRFQTRVHRQGTMTKRPPTEAADLGGKVMEWFNQKISIAGTQVPNWLIVLGAVIVVLVIYTLMRH